MTIEKPPGSPNGGFDATAEPTEERLLDHMRNPYHRGRHPSPTAAHMIYHPVCGDMIEWTLGLENGLIVSAWQTGAGCILSQSAASLLAEAIEGQRLDDVIAWPEERVLELVGISVTPRRKGCALLPMQGLRQLQAVLVAAQANPPVSS